MRLVVVVPRVLHLTVQCVTKAEGEPGMRLVTMKTQLQKENWNILVNCSYYSNT